MDPSAVTRLRSALAGRYTLERELGRGGMATVWLARDLKHDRLVALKVLRAELAAALGPERFLREIKLTAGLDHPHSLPLLDSGEAAGFLFYTMPYVEGESLRDRLTRERQLPIDDALAITREVADALGYAHSRGVIHRDIKPENILLAGGHARVADFGIATALAVAGGERLTQTGLAVGTPAYMSPEQASGDANIDPRSDIYSLGCMLYEMLIGDPPFTGATPQVILARKSLEGVPPLRPIRETVPPAVEQAVTQALAKIPADRFATVGQFAEALERPNAAAASLGLTAAPPVSRPWRRWLALPVVLLLAAVVYVGVSRFIGSGARWGADTPPRVLVLPFESQGQPGEEYFADGITDLIASRLARLSGLRVIGRTTANKYRGTDKTIAQIAAELNVDYVLEGTISWDRSNPTASRVRVIPQLIRASDESQLWADPYEGTLADMFDLQADVAERVARALDIALLEPERRAVRERLTEDEEAYDAYLRGSQYSPFWTVLTSDRRLAIESFERAVALDPEFAEAHAFLSAHYSGLAEWTPTEAERALPLAERHADRALALRPNLAWGHLAKAAYLSVRYTDAELLLPHLDRAERAAPYASEILEAIAFFYKADFWEWERALRYNLRALELDPLRPDNAYGVGFTYFALRRHAEAESYLARAIELAPDRLEYHQFTAFLYLSWQGSIDRASGVLQAAAQRLGLEPVIVTMMDGGWVGRLLAADDWYRRAVERTSLESPGLDSARYYLHKAFLFDGLGNGDRSKAYADSAARVLEGRPAEGSALMIMWQRLNLAFAHGLAGDAARAVREARGALPAAGASPGIELYPRIGLALMLALAGDYGAAVEELDWAMSRPNFVTPAWLAADPTLAPLRATPQYQALVRKYDNER